MRVVLTREAQRNTEMRAWLPAGAHVDEVPLTATEYVERGNVERKLRASAHDGQFAALVLTSSRAVGYVQSALQSLREGASVLSVGPATSSALRELGVTVSVEATSRAIELATHISSGPVLLLGAGEVRDELTRALEARSIAVTHVACYYTRALTPSAAQQGILSRAQVVLIGAPSAWSVARPWVAPSTWVVVPGTTTASVVLADHERVLEGWGPSLRERLANLDV